MKDFRNLKVGDRIRIQRVAEGDLAQAKAERTQRIEDAGITANTLEKVIKQCPVQTIAWIDEYGYPWFECTITNRQGEREEHCFAIMENESWEMDSVDA
jgi:hypothetical protein